MKNEDYLKLLRHDFGSYLRFAFSELNPSVNYQHNWHIDVIAHHLTRVANGECKRLIINMPPRMLKSHCASIALPTWMLGRTPHKKLLYLHSGKELGRELEDQCAELMASSRYRAIFPHATIKQNAAHLKTHHGGERKFLPITGRLTGLGADVIIIDDPISTSDARDEAKRKNLHKQFDENILQRLNNKKSGAIVLVMQRLHKDDLTGYLLAKDNGWEHVSLPAIAMEDELWTLPCNRTYSRKKGEPLHPERDSREDLIEALCAMSGYTFAYQYMQGAYKPVFDDTFGYGSKWVYPMRVGEFYDKELYPERIFGLIGFNEFSFIYPRIFGIGEDPIPPNMRNYFTQEELELSLKRQREAMLEHQRKVASGELEY